MNPWAIPYLVAFLISVYLCIYIIYKNPTNPINRAFFFLTLFSSLWLITEFMVYFVPYYAKVGLIRVEWVCRVFVNAFALNFALVFPKRRKLLAQKWGYFVFFTPAIIVSILLYHSIHGIETFYFGFAPSYTFAVRILTVYSALYLFCTLSLFISIYLSPGTSVAKHQIFWPTIGMGIIILYNIICTLIMTIFKIYPPGPDLNNMLFITTMAMFTIGMVKYKLFIIEPLAEELVVTPQKYTLERGRSYIIKEEKLDKSYKIFYDQVTHGRAGLAITKLPPDKVRERYKIIKTPILWLTFKNVENAVSPKDMEGIKSAISDFVKKVENSLVLLDCFDQIVLVNGFEKAFSSLTVIKNICKESSATLLVSINTEMFDREQIVSIEKEMEEV